LDKSLPINILKEYDFKTSLKLPAYSFQQNYQLEKSNFKIAYPKRRDYSKFIIPGALLTYGILNRNTKKLEELTPPTRGGVTSIDDRTRYVPYAGIYLLDFLGVKAEHNLIDRTFITLTSYALMQTTVTLLKTHVHTWRPNLSDQRSFPSGHTSTAFVGAHIMFKEYKNSSFLLASTGYLFAVTTGVLRVVNKCHYVPDVCAGAAIGILSVEASYYLLPLFHKILGVKLTKDWVLCPLLVLTLLGLGLIFFFNSLY